MPMKELFYDKENATQGKTGVTCGTNYQEKSKEGGKIMETIAKILFEYRLKKAEEQRQQARKAKWDAYFKNGGKWV